MEVSFNETIYWYEIYASANLPSKRFAKVSMSETTATQGGTRTEFARTGAEKPRDRFQFDSTSRASDKRCWALEPTIPAMGTLYLVRHGQASFGAANYDQLSPRGHEQAVRLGAYWRERGQRFDAVLTGTLHRHAQTLAGIAEGLGGAPEAHALPGLNEYDSEALIRAIHPEPLPRPDTPELYRQHFRLLCDALAQWMGGTISPQGMPDWERFAGGVRAALDLVRRQHVGQNVLLVSSGGPISAAVGHVLGTAPEVTIALNMRIRNSAVTEFSVSPKRLMLQTFNTLPHLDTPEHRSWITHA